MIQCVVKGDFKRTNNFLKKVQKLDFDSLLLKHAEEGVLALSRATPKRSGKTAASWNYVIERGKGRVSIYWTNSNFNNGVPIAVILEYGHGTGWGGYVQGRHYISPAIQPVFDRISEDVRREVANS